MNFKYYNHGLNTVFEVKPASNGTVDIPWLYRYFTGIHRVLPCPVVLYFLKQPGPFSGNCRFNTVYPDSMRCMRASLLLGSGWPRCRHLSDAVAENRDSVNEALD